MKIAEIISVGTELLMGQVANTDAQFISALLPGAGFGVYYHTVVGDNKDRLAQCFKKALERSDLVVLTGGLGPTEDDLTKNTVAEALGLKLVIDEETVKDLENYFSRSGRKMSQSNLSQAYFPEGSIILKNKCGTAPGCMINKSVNGISKIVVLLPGPPSELKPMFEDEVLPVLEKAAEEVLKSKFFDIIGVPESEVESRLSDIISGRTNPTAATYVKEGIVTVRVSACGTSDTASALIEKDAEVIRERFGKNLAGENGQSLQETVVRLCEKHKLTVASAESCTGGMVSELITSVPGASNVIKSSVVVYSNEAKIKILGVDPELINQYGVVSEQTALAMAEKTAVLCGSDIGVSTTGNAGPGTLENKPAGLVYVGLYFRGKTAVKECLIRGSREHIRRRVSNTALNMVREAVLGIGEDNDR
ncbi:MAG: competence/damage-inducible protein A [Clostridia bacterium]|nr:competence/damage-inducible protein A [Clostridia bacterium]